MKRPIVFLLLASLIMAFILTSCIGSPESNNLGQNDRGENKASDPPNLSEIETDKVRIWFYQALEGTVPEMIEKYKKLKPFLDTEFDLYSFEGNSDSYSSYVDTALQAGGSVAPDIYFVEYNQIYKYTKGDATGYAASYKELGIDVDRLIDEAKISKYIVDIGTRPTDNQVVALSYEGTAGIFIYRRSIAKDVWGTDDPVVVQDKIGPGWDRFFDAAEDLKSKGYAIVSSHFDLWRQIDASADSGWFKDGDLYIDPKREAFLDISKKLEDNGYHNDTILFSEEWTGDMWDNNERQVLGFFGPAWLLSYVIFSHSGYKPDANQMGSFGDWAVCQPTENFFWDGNWVLARKDPKYKKTVADLLEWMTLDISDTGPQYELANGTFSKDRLMEGVASIAVMERSDGSLDILGGQNIFDVLVPASEATRGKEISKYDDIISDIWIDQVDKYTQGKKTKSQAIKDFKALVKEQLDALE